MAIVYKSYFKEAAKKINDSAKRQREKANEHLVAKIKDKIAQMFGINSTLYKGVGYVDNKDQSFVGMGKPASRAHLIEFGTDDRYSKSGKYSGHVAPKPFLLPTFNEERKRIISILSERWF